ncbi:hypothetical protein FRC03_011178 [Tulasnella sp. 419]|nr:hypothetical protein FRC03_011178 [Tulasnella sp. 419]
MMVHSDLQSVFEKFERCAHQGSQGFTSAQQALAYAISSWDDGGGTRAERFTMACLQTSKGLFEYIYVTNDHVVDIVWSVLVEKYPKSFQDFIANPCLRLAFSRLLEFYMSLPPDADIPQDVIRAYRSAGPAMKVIEAIDKYMKAPSAAEQATPIDPDENRNDEEDGMGLVPKVKSKQAERKRRMKASARGHKQPGGMSVLDPSLFYSANYVPPSGIEDAAALGLEVVNDLKRVISDYLNGLVNINDLIKRAYEGQLVADVAKGDNDPGESDDPREVQAEQNTPAAFPHIQPIRAAALFEDAAVSGELGEWHILISTRAFGQLRQLSLGDGAIFEIVKKKIRQLSQGFFSDDNQKHLVGRDQEVPIFEAKMTRDLRLVYQVECGSRVTTEEHNMGATRYEQQQLRIYGIYTHAQLDKRFWASVAYQSIKRGKEYRRRCLHREIPRTRTKGYNVTPPAIFPYTPSTGEENSVNRVEGNIPIMEDSDYLALHEILALEKFIPYSHTLLDTVRQDQDASHIFSVSQKEEEIIYHPSSCLVIGRSGTGKTTTMLFKMIALEKAAQHSSSTIRQLFVTQSRVLAARVEEYFKNLLSSSFPSIYQSATGHQEKEKTKEKEKDLLELDDEVEDDSRLPAKWSDLEQRHFPLFITFDQVSQ